MVLTTQTPSPAEAALGPSLLEEKLLSVSEAAKWFPHQEVHRSTIYRWINDGIDGTQLEAVRIGGHIYTSAQALIRFVQAQTERANASKKSVTVHSKPAVSDLNQRNAKALDGLRARGLTV